MSYKQILTTNDIGTGANQVAAGNHNHNSLYPKKDGSGASGTWEININGNASTATKLTNLTTADEASSTDTWRRVWFAYNDNSTGRPAYSDTFAYQSSTETVKATKFQGALSGNAASASKVNNKLTVGSKSYDGSAAVTITASDLELASAMLFLGTTTTAISDGATKNPVTIGGANKTVTAGNVVFYGSKEFVWTGSAWEELGNEGSYKIVQAAVADPSASGALYASKIAF